MLKVILKMTKVGNGKRGKAALKVSRGPKIKKGGGRGSDSGARRDVLSKKP
jgi:hypothetical protein